MIRNAAPNPIPLGSVISGKFNPVRRSIGPRAFETKQASTNMNSGSRTRFRFNAISNAFSVTDVEASLRTQLNPWTDKANHKITVSAT
jgi:hypothetical protein